MNPPFSCKLKTTTVKLDKSKNVRTNLYLVTGKLISVEWSLVNKYTIETKLITSTQYVPWWDMMYSTKQHFVQLCLVSWCTNIFYSCNEEIMSLNSSKIHEIILSKRSLYVHILNTSCTFDNFFRAIAFVENQFFISDKQLESSITTQLSSVFINYLTSFTLTRSLCESQFP